MKTKLQLQNENEALRREIKRLVYVIAGKNLLILSKERDCAKLRKEVEQLKIQTASKQVMNNPALSGLITRVNGKSDYQKFIDEDVDEHVPQIRLDGDNLIVEE